MRAFALNTDLEAALLPLLKLRHAPPFSPPPSLPLPHSPLPPPLFPSPLSPPIDRRTLPRLTHYIAQSISLPLFPLPASSSSHQHVVNVSTMPCSHCSRVNAPLKCSRCKLTTYCSKPCQLASWKSHKKTCRPPAALAAAELNTMMASVGIADAQMELAKAREAVDKLRREAAQRQQELEDLSKSPQSSTKSTKSRDATSAPQYGSQKYWELSYASPSVYTGTTGAASYEWYMSSLPRFQPLLAALLPHNSSTAPTTVLDIGCGNSTLLSYLLSCGIITTGIGMDYSPSVIKTLTANNTAAALQYHHHDLTSPIPAAIIPPESIHCAVDKGTLDAILSAGTTPESSLAATRTATTAFLNVLTVLLPAAPLVVITNLPPGMALQFFEKSLGDVTR